MKTAKGFFIGVITTLLCVLMVNTVFGAQLSKTITAVYNDIKITIDGKAIEPRDANGNPVEPFISDGSTYLPVRAVADAVGYDVSWDGDTNTVGLSKKEPASSTPTQTGLNYEITHSSVKYCYGSSGQAYAQIMVEIKNTGTDSIRLNSGACDVIDETGRLIKSISNISAYPRILHTGEKGYYYEYTSLDEEFDTERQLSLNIRPSIEKSISSNVNFKTSEIEIYKNKFMIPPYIRGWVENTTKESHSQIAVVIILFDKNNIPIGKASTVIFEEIAPGERIGFDASADLLPDKLNIDDIKDYKIFAYPYWENLRD